jgi:hypothetical protein
MKDRIRGQLAGHESDRLDEVRPVMELKVTNDELADPGRACRIGRLPQLTTPGNVLAHV